MKRTLALTLALFAAPALAGTGTVAGSKHDFSASGPGPLRATREQSPCKFCHISHAAGPGMSNRPASPAAERPYESATMKGRASAPEGASRLCLSCHDGTVAVGATRKQPIPMSGGAASLTPGSRGYLGTDLSTSHPISVPLTTNGRTHAPIRGDRVQLDGASRVQCTSCHDPHDEWGDPARGKFLVKPSGNSKLCTSCHEAGLGKGAPSLSHMTAPPKAAPSLAQGADDGGCASCHAMHGADPERGQLLRADRKREELCLACHGAGSAKPVAAQYRQPFGHGVSQPGQHDAAEGKRAPPAIRLPETSPGAARHVTCVDCHDPHVSNPAPGVAPVVGGALAGVSGIDLDGEEVAAARYEYEICFKCHGDSANKPQDSAIPAPGTARRANDDFNLRRAFAPTAASSHPVATSPRGVSPSLKPEARAQVYCSDCHSSDQAVAGKVLAKGFAQRSGTAPRGPHGSAYAHILERQYLTADPTPESPEAYALCYKCHDRERLLSDASTFPRHRAHVVGQSTPCSVCHDAHGISAQSGTTRGNAHLIAFDLEVVKGGAAGGPSYDATGPGRGTCSLTCHGVLHAPTSRAFSY